MPNTQLVMSPDRAFYRQDDARMIEALVGGSGASKRLSLELQAVSTDIVLCFCKQTLKAIDQL